MGLDGGKGKMGDVFVWDRGTDFDGVSESSQARAQDDCNSRLDVRAELNRLDRLPKTVHLPPATTALAFVLAAADAPDRVLGVPALRVRGIRLPAVREVGRPETVRAGVP